MLALAAAGIGLLVSSPHTAGPPYRLSGHGSLGLSGLGAGLRSAGIGVSESLTPTIPDRGLTISVEPQSVSHDESAAWLRSVRAGAVVVLAADRPSPLTQALGLRYGFPDEARPTAAGRRAFPGLRAGAVAAATTFTDVPAGDAVLIGTRGAAVAVLVPYGRGSVWALSQPRLQTNAGVAGDGLAIALPLAARARGVVRVDAFHQGGSPTLGSLAYLPRWLQLVILEAAIVALLAALAAAQRLGPVAADDPAAGRSTVELVRSLAAMHRSAGRLDAVTRPLAAAYRSRLGGLSAGAEPALAELESAASAPAAVRACVRIEEITRRVTGGDR
jgi:antitoxin (DNA-binding transcriptional repressor) of toxin-antitoxin stability system